MLLPLNHPAPSWGSGCCWRSCPPRHLDHYNPGLPRLPGRPSQVSLDPPLSHGNWNPKIVPPILSLVSPPDCFCSINPHTNLHFVVCHCHDGGPILSIGKTEPKQPSRSSLVVRPPACLLLCFSAPLAAGRGVLLPSANLLRVQQVPSHLPWKLPSVTVLSCLPTFSCVSPVQIVLCTGSLISV